MGNVSSAPRTAEPTAPPLDSDPIDVGFSARAALLPTLPEAHDKALAAAASGVSPLFRLSVRLMSTAPTAPIFYDNEGGRFAQPCSAKLVQEERRPHLLEVTLADLGCSLTSLECVSVDGRPLAACAGSVRVRMEDLPAGRCPVFRCCCVLPSNPEGHAPTPPGQRDILLLAVHYSHGATAEETIAPLQVKWYTAAPARVRKARSGKRLAAATYRHDGSKMRAPVRWTFKEDKT